MKSWVSGARRSKVIQNAIVQPHGMVLVTGPTGSGKSTTLFSVLSMLNSPNVNISTVEDPVEYRIFGANQIQVNPIAGMTFTNGLRALLRQDPNIIMVGEIRDGETAQLAVQAALTGHLVFTTLHTNNAATCLPRLLDMGIEPFLIASTVRAVVGQRLVRRLCVDCREASTTPMQPARNALAATFHLDKPADHEISARPGSPGPGRRHRQSRQQEIGRLQMTLASTEHHIKHLWKAHPDGCDSCNHTGYHGRIGIYEVLDNSPSIQKLIVGNDTSENIQTVAIEEGMVTMQIDGFIKALRGQTTVEEVLRVTASRNNTMKYSYKALRRRQNHRRHAEAASKEALIASLSHQGIHPLAIKQLDETASPAVCPS